MPKDETNIRKNRSFVHGEAVFLAAKCCPLQAALPLQSLLSDTTTASDPMQGYYILGCHGPTPTVIAVAEPLGYYVVMDKIACWHLQLRGTQPTPCCMHYSRPRQRFPRRNRPSKTLRGLLRHILFVVHFIIFINILTELILKIGFGASIGCRE